MFSRFLKQFPLLFICFFCFFFFFDFSFPIVFSYYFFLDKFRFYLIYLRFLVFCFVIIIISKNYILITTITLLFIFIISRFLVKDLIFFYIFFELSLLPLLLIIITYGFQPERLEAAVYFLLYALVGSFPLLRKIIYYQILLGKAKLFFYFFRNYFVDYYLNPNKIMGFFWMFPFLIKLPIYGFHLWLPKAHVESPVIGSMILASVMLKLGAYGLFRFSQFNFLNSFELTVCWVLVTSFWVRLIAYRNVDIKALIAYSSISHMSFLIIIIFYLNCVTSLSLLMILVGHGFVRRRMFFIFNSLYNKSLSRSIILKKALRLKSKLFFFFFFFVLIFNSSFPLNLTFFSEVILRLVLICFYNFFLIFFILSLFFVGLYKIILFLITRHGYQKTGLHSNHNVLIITNKDASLSFFHLIFKIFTLFFFFLWFFFWF